MITPLDNLPGMIRAQPFEIKRRVAESLLSNPPGGVFRAAREACRPALPPSYMSPTVFPNEDDVVIEVILHGASP